jgi:hypothetical protein
MQYVRKNLVFMTIEQSTVPGVIKYGLYIKAYGMFRDHPFPVVLQVYVYLLADFWQK